MLAAAAIAQRVDIDAVTYLDTAIDDKTGWIEAVDCQERRRLHHLRWVQRVDGTGDQHAGFYLNQDGGRPGRGREPPRRSRKAPLRGDPAGGCVPERVLTTSLITAARAGSAVSSLVSTRSGLSRVADEKSLVRWW